MANDNGGGGAILVAFVLGAIAGAATALLLAPSTGEETRRLIAEKAREGREKASEAARQGKEFVERQRTNLSAAVERGKEAYHRTRAGDVKGTEESA
jgi:gas vesicle protein